MTNTVEKFISNLSKKVQFSTSKGEFVHLENGFGYRIKNNKMTGACVNLMGGIIGKSNDEVKIICDKF